MSLKYVTAALWCLTVSGCGSKEIATLPPPPPPPPVPPSVLVVTPASIGFQDTVGTANPELATAAITAEGGSVTGLSVAAITFGPGASGWLTAWLDTTVTPAKLRLRVSDTGIAPGTYTATVAITAAMASNAPSVSITMALWAPPPTTQGMVLTVAGNIAKCTIDEDEATAKLLDAAPGVVFTAGDNAFPSGTSADYANCYEPTWGRHKARTWAVLGNHEYLSGSADAAFDYFGDRAGPRGKGFYSTDVGDWHIIVLNDNQNFVPFNAGSEQEQWLRADLAADTRRCTMALWHQPRFLSSNTPGFIEAPNRKVLWDDLYDANVDVIVNGHQHQYERMAPLAADGSPDSVRGIRQFNVGTGGESVHLPQVAINPHSEVLAAAFGVLQLTLYADRYDWRFIPVAGESFTDAGSGTCH